MDIGPKRDLVGDLTKSVRNKGLKMGLYYSIIEWETNPTRRVESGSYINKKMVEKYGIPIDKYVDDHLLLQLKEIVTKYKPSLIFSDGGEWDEDENYWKTKEFLCWLYNNSPNKDEVVVNDRWCKGMPGNHGDYYSSEYGDAEGLEGHPWEESRGMGGSYGYNRAEGIDDYNSSAGLIQELIAVVSRGGNLLLNVGPSADGRIPVIMQQRLVDIGEWLDLNGEAIYKTTTWDNVKENKNDNVYYTKKRSHLYAICTKWPSNDLVIRINSKINNIVMLGCKKNIEWQINENNLIIKTSQITPEEIYSKYAYVYKISL